MVVISQLSFPFYSYYAFVLKVFVLHYKSVILFFFTELYVTYANNLFYHKTFKSLKCLLEFSILFPLFILLHYLIMYEVV